MKKSFYNQLKHLLIAAFFCLTGIILYPDKQTWAAGESIYPSVIEYFVNAYSGLLSTNLEEVTKHPENASVGGFLSTVANEINFLTAEKTVYLTFDDGPNEPYTSRVLEILDREGVKAVFFVCGENVERYPDTLKKTKEMGHLIGNHGYSHSPFSVFTGIGMQKEIEKNNQLIKNITGETTDFFRPPFGFMTPEVKKYVEENHYKTILPDIIAFDWIDKRSPEEIEKVVVSKVKPGSIIVLHDGRGVEIVNRSNMVKALPNIIDKLKAKGYVFKQVNQNTYTNFNLSRLYNVMIY